MKRLFTIIMTLMLGISLTACASKDTAQGNTNAEVALATVVDAIKEAYGEDYLPNMLVEGEMLDTTYGLKTDMYQEVHVEVPMISAQSDFLIAVKTAEGKQADVVKALTEYREYLVNDALQYPMNQLKLQSSRLIEKDGFVFLVSLGVIPMDVDGDDAITAKAVELNDVAEKAINSVLK